MNYFFSLAALLMVITGPDADGQHKENNSFSLEEYQWERRILVITSPDSNSKAYKKIISTLEERRSGMEERHMLVVLLPENALAWLMLEPQSQVVIDQKSLRKQLKLDTVEPTC